METGGKSVSSASKLLDDMAKKALFNSCQHGACLMSRFLELTVASVIVLVYTRLRLLETFPTEI